MTKGVNVETTSYTYTKFDRIYYTSMTLYTTCQPHSCKRELYYIRRTSSSFISSKLEENGQVFQNLWDF